MATDGWTGDFVQSYINFGFELGFEQGFEKGKRQARDMIAKAQIILKVIDTRGLQPTPEQRAMVTADAGLDKLNRWFDRALTATTAADIFSDDED